MYGTTQRIKYRATFFYYGLANKNKNNSLGLDYGHHCVIVSLPPVLQYNSYCYVAPMYVLSFHPRYTIITSAADILLPAFVTLIYNCEVKFGCKK